MKPEFPHLPPEELEVQITALLLGELSAAEAEALRERIASDTQLQHLHDNLEKTIELVEQTAATREHTRVAKADAPTLSADRREKLFASFKTHRLQIKRSRATRRDLFALAAMVLGLVAVTAVMFRSHLSDSFKMMEQVGAPELELAEQTPSPTFAPPMREGQDPLRQTAASSPADGKVRFDRTVTLRALDAGSYEPQQKKLAVKVENKWENKSSLVSSASDSTKGATSDDPLAARAGHHWLHLFYIRRARVRTPATCQYRPPPPAANHEAQHL